MDRHKRTDCTIPASLTLNRNKCELNKSTLEFLGFVFSADPKKVLTVQHASAPTSATEMHSLLGMANYCSRFIPDFATVTESLRRLTWKGTPWEWGAKQESAFKHLKELLTRNTVMVYFFPRKDTELIVDASPLDSDPSLRILGRLSLMLKGDTLKQSMNHSQLCGVVNIFTFTFMEIRSH